MNELERIEAILLSTIRVAVVSESMNKKMEFLSGDISRFKQEVEPIYYIDYAKKTIEDFFDKKGIKIDVSRMCFLNFADQYKAYFGKDYNGSFDEERLFIYCTPVEDYFEVPFPKRLSPALTSPNFIKRIAIKSMGELCMGNPQEGELIENSEILGYNEIISKLYGLSIIYAGNKNGKNGRRVPGFLMFTENLDYGIILMNQFIHSANYEITNPNFSNIEEANTDLINKKKQAKLLSYR